MVPAATGKLETVADEVVAIATRYGGSATKGLADKGRLSVLVDLPSSREPEFRAAISSIMGPTKTTSPAASEAPRSSAFAEATADKTTPATAVQQPGSTIPAKEEKKSFIVHVVEAAPKQD